MRLRKLTSTASRSTRNQVWIWTALLLASLGSFGERYAFGGPFDSWVMRHTNPSSYFTGVTFGKGLYVVVGQQGQVLTSPDAITWTSRESGTTTWIGDVEFGNDLFVAVGQNGLILISSDGVSWTPRTSDTTANFNRLRFINDRFIAVGDQSTVASSTDGINWTIQHPPGPFRLYNVNCGNGLYVIVGQYDPILISTDAISWEPRYIGVTHAGDVTYGNGVFVISGYQGLVVTSADGANWTRRDSLPTAGTAGLAFAQGTFVGAGHGVFSSDDGINWTQRFYGAPVFWNVKYVNGTFIAVGESGGILQSGIVALPQSPSIVAAPQSRSVPSGANVTFSVAASGTPPLHYQWRRDGVNLPGATGATLTLNGVTAAASGGYSVRVWNAHGSVVSATAHLAVLEDGAAGVLPQQPPDPWTMLLPPYQAGKDSLVFVTHGRTPEDAATPHAWVDDMANAIRNRAPANWMVIGYKWTEEARADFVTVIPKAYNRGKQIGNNIVELGHSAPNQRWEHVHLIGHSAGAELIEAAASRIKRNAVETVVHCTFLDPYLSPYLVERYAYGANADWADNYYTQDLETFSWTEGRLSHAHTVDVGWLDGDARGTTVGFGGHVAISTHSYPHQFYLASVRGENDVCAAQYGYARSKAGGGWEQRGAYPNGNTPVILCPPADAASIEKQEFFATVNQPLRFEEFPFATSATGVSVSDWGFALSGRSLAPQPAPGQVSAQGGDDGPAWLAVAVPVSNAVSFVQFDAGYTSTNGAEGLLTVYWNTNEIGLVDERMVEAGLQTYLFALPGAVSEGLYTLSFRLDAFNGTASSVSVTNVLTGFAGFDGSVRLEMALGSNSAPVLHLSGTSNHVYLVQGSTNLLDWETAALVVNTNGTVQYADPVVTNHTQRFYRAVLY